MNDIIQRVIQAIWDADWSDKDGRVIGSTIEKPDLETIAKAAVEAMRTPDAFMISAGDAQLPFTRGTETHRMAGGITPEGIWTAMIEAAICEHDWQENTEDEDVCFNCEASRYP